MTDERRPTRKGPIRATSPRQRTQLTLDFGRLTRQQKDVVRALVRDGDLEALFDWIERYATRTETT